ncbi:zinc finger protein 2-like [Saccostrea cucullata]|uniref:zinc finger protein 2-like n=1 Tax=Saccostrea cuccullata TaxID=36930 RepID=UPI002ED22DEA
MPKCLMHSVRNYRSRKYTRHSEFDQNVMTTRSGLAIRKVSVKHMFSGSTKYAQETVEIKQRQNYKSSCTPKQKSMHHLPFVTRFYLGFRVPDLDLCGNDSKEIDSREEEPMQISFGHSRKSEYRLLDFESDEDSLESGSDDDFCNNIIAQSKEFRYQCMAIKGSTTKSDSSRNILEALSGLQPVEERIRDSTCDFQVTSIENRTEIEKCSKYPSPTQSVTAALSDLRLSGPAAIMSTNPSPTVTTFTAPTITTIRSGVIFQAKPAFTDLPPFKCEVCEKEFYVSANYTTHLRTHTAQHKNKCDVCGKVFTRSWLLKGHMRTHTGERPFICPHEDCDKAFADKSNLRSHMLIHSVKSKNFSCQKCGRSFAQKRYLHKHLLEVCRVIR